MKKLQLLFLVTLAMLLAACGNDKAENEAQKQEQKDIVIIENNDLTFEYDKAPTRAISLNQHVTEIMLALGLEDSMIGTAYLDDEIYPSLKEAYDKVPVLAAEYPSKEQVIEAEADFLYGGWPSALAEKSIGTAAEWQEMGVNSYLQTSSVMNEPKLDDVFTDIRNIAKIFRIEERGEQVIEEMRANVEAVQAKLPEQKDPLRVFVYDSGDKELLTAGQNIMNNFVTEAGGTNIFSTIEKGWTSVSKEDVVAHDPEVIVIMDYGGIALEDKLTFLKNDPALKNTIAVKNEHFVVMPLSAASEGVRAADAIEILAKGFYPENF